MSEEKNSINPESENEEITQQQEILSDDTNDNDTSDQYTDETAENAADEVEYTEENSAEYAEDEYAEEDYYDEAYEDEVYDDEDEAYEDSVSLNIIAKIRYYINLYKARLDAMEPERRKRTIIITAVCVLLVILVFTDFIPILPNAYNRFYVGNDYLIGETQSGVYDSIGKDVIYAGNGSIMVFGPDMGCKFKAETALGSALLETDGENAVVYYNNSKEAYVVKGGKALKNIKESDKITAACVNDKGYYGFVYDEAGYESCVDIFDSRDSSIYKWHTNNKVIDISVSDNGSSLVAASYEPDASVVNGKLIFFDTGKTEPVKEVVTKSNIFSELKFISDDVVIAFGDTQTVAYTSKGVMKWLIDYKDRTLKNYEVTDSGDIAFIFDRYSSEMSESTVEIYSSSGRLKGKFESKDNVKYVSYNNNRYLLSLDRKTILLDTDADVMETKKHNKEFRKAVLYHNYNFAFSISDSIAEILSVNH